MAQGEASRHSFYTLKALILDPHPLGRSMLTHALQQIGFGTIETCASRSHLLERMQDCGPDAVIMDWSADHPAPETIRLVRSSRSPNPYVPIIVASAIREAGAVLEARDAGMSEFFLKPFTVDMVRSRMIAALSKPRPFVESAIYFGPDRRRRAAEFGGAERRRVNRARSPTVPPLRLDQASGVARSMR